MKNIKNGELKIKTKLKNIIKITKKKYLNNIKNGIKITKMNYLKN